MVRIRLRRVGSSHQASYRVIVADKESPRDGRFIEIIGQYNPRTSPERSFLTKNVFFIGWVLVLNPQSRFKNFLRQ